MPVKVKCPKCQKVLNVPDTARGKAVKCPGCEARVSVPAEDGGTAKPPKSAKPAAKSAKAKQSTSEDEDFLSALDAERVEDENIRICPKCGAFMYDEESDECPECGVDSRTGQLTARRKRKMSLKGADPRDFFKVAWTDSWQYLIEHIGLSLRLTVLWSSFVVLIILCYYGLRVWCSYVPGSGTEGLPEGLAAALREIANAVPMFFFVFPIPGDTPPQIFWKCLALIIMLGFPGTYWNISHQIIAGTLDSRDKPFKVSFEVVTSVAMGIKAQVWPYVLTLPFFWVPLIGLLPGLCFPLAMVHMTRPYAHPAWLPWDMMKVFFKNAGHALYWLLMNFVTHIPAILILGLGGFFFPSHILPSLQGWAHSAAAWLAAQCGESTPGWIYGVFHPILTLTFAGTSAFLVFPFIAFPSVFMMRANGLLGYYCKNQMDLIGKMGKHIPAGFWPRWLAYVIDSFVLSIIIGIIGGGLGGLAIGMNYWGLTWAVWPLFGAAIIASLGIHAFYFVKAESSSSQGTLGKRALGMVVIDMKGNRITQSAAFGRWAIRYLVPFGYLGSIMAAFSEKKQALHDSMTNTQVVWEGD